MTTQDMLDEFEKEFLGGNCVQVGTKNNGGILHCLQVVKPNLCVCRFREGIKEILTLQEQRHKEEMKEMFNELNEYIQFFCEHHTLTRSLPEQFEDIINKKILEI